MGILLKDQKTLYSDLNLGVIDDSGEVTPPAGKQLPGSPWAVFEGTVAPGTVSSSCVWADQTNHGNNMTLTQDGSAASPSAIYSNDHLVVGGENGKVGGLIPGTTFAPGSGYTVNILVAYTETLSSAKMGDGLFSLIATNNGTEQNLLHHFYIGNRSTAARQILCSYHPSSGSNTTRPQSPTAIASSLAGLHLITLVIPENDARFDVYLDGVKHSDSEWTTSNDYSMKDEESPNLRFFGFDTSTAANNWYLFGDVYAVSVYNTALTTAQIGLCCDYYAEHYNNYNPGE